MANTASPSTTGDVPASNPSTRIGKCTRRQHQHFKGQNYQLWKLTVTTDNLKPANYNKIKQLTSPVTTQICEGNLTHVLQAIEAGTHTVFNKPTLTSANPTDQIVFKIEHEEYSKDKRTYNNNKTKLAQSLIGQCELPVVNQLEGMKGYGMGHGFSAHSTKCAVASAMIRYPSSKSSTPSAKCLPTNNKIITPHLHARMNSYKKIAQ